MFDPLLAKIASVLRKSDVPYIVIGGQAVLRYGEPRLTRDIDITMGVDVDQWQRIVETLQAHGFEILVEDPKAFVEETYVLPARDRSTEVRVDFVFSRSPYEATAIGRAVTFEVDGADVSFASPEDLLIHKIIAGRPRDLDDARSVLVKQAPNLDRDYIKRWLAEFQKALAVPYLEQFQELEDSIR